MNNKGIYKILSFLLTIISIICLAILFCIAAFLLYYIISNQVAKSKGERPYISIYTIVSPSMEPKIMVNDVIVVTRVKSEQELNKGDIITFYSDVLDTGGYTVTHRIYKKYNSHGRAVFETKGDNNAHPDLGTINYNNVVGKVVFIIPKLGYVQKFVTSKFGWILVILIPALGIILADVKKLIKIFRIKEQIEEIPKIREVEIIREREEDKKLRAVVEEANKLNNRK